MGTCLDSNRIQKRLNSVYPYKTARNHKVLPIGVTDYSGLPDDLPPLCGYESKWFPDSPYWTQLKFIPANLPDNIQREIVDWSLLLKDRFECHDSVRLDWRCNSKGEPRLLEINPNPGWCWDGQLNQMAQFEGMSYANMLQMILRSAEARYQMIALARTGNGDQPIRERAIAGV